MERAERLEQLRFLENGVAIHVAETSFDTVGVDTEEDLRRVEQILFTDSRYTEKSAFESGVDVLQYPGLESSIAKLACVLCSG